MVNCWLLLLWMFLRLHYVFKETTFSLSKVTIFIFSFCWFSITIFGSLAWSMVYTNVLSNYHNGVMSARNNFLLTLIIAMGLASYTSFAFVCKLYKIHQRTQKNTDDAPKDEKLLKL